MEEFFTSLGAFLITQGPFAVIAGAEGAIIFRLFNLLTKSYEDRIEDKKVALEASYKMMSDRTAELDRLARLLESGRSGR